MKEIMINNLVVKYDETMRFSDGDLMKEIYSCSERDSYGGWNWYRNIMIQAHERGLIRIVGHSDEVPFWWRSFKDSIEVLNEQFKTALANGSLK